jgi:hypothetical protein
MKTRVFFKSATKRLNHIREISWFQSWNGPAPVAEVTLFSVPPGDCRYTRFVQKVPKMAVWSATSNEHAYARGVDSDLDSNL